MATMPDVLVARVPSDGKEVVITNFRRIRIAVDLDGVLYNWGDTVRFLVNHYLGANLPPIEEFADKWEAFEEYLGPTYYRWVVTTGVKYGLYRYGHVYRGSIEALRELDKIGDIIVVTHRPREVLHDTLDWIAFHRIPMTEFHFLHTGTPKSTVKADVYLDDRLKVVEDCVVNANGALVLLWDRPWNRSRNIPGVIRVSEWSEVISLCVQHAYIPS